MSFGNFLFSFSISIILSVVLILLIISIYLIIRKKQINTNIDMMNKIYGYGNYLDEETIALRFMRNATEQYLELMLSIPEFDFDHPVYYDEYGMLKPIYSYPSQSKYNTTSTGQKTTPGAQSGQKDLTNQKANEQETMEETSLKEIEREINDELRKDPDFLGFTNRDIQNLGIAIASQIAVGKAVSMGAKKTGKFLAKRGFSKSVAVASKFLGKKIAVKTVAKTVAKPISLPLKYAAKGTMKVIGKFGTRVGFKMGMISARTIAKKAFTKVASKVGLKTGSKIAAKTGAKIAASATTKAAAKAGMGPVGWAMMAFDVTSIGLDLGDVGGYMMLDQYRAIRDNIKKEITKNFKNAGVIYPYTIGPLDKYRERSTAEYVDMLYKAQVEILKKDKKYENLVKSKLLPKYNSNDDKYADILLKLSDKDKKQLENIATKNMCKTVGGDVYKGLCIFEDFYEKEKQKRLNKLLSPDGKYMKPLISKYTTWMSSNPNATQSQSESKFDQLFNSMINMDKIEKEVMKTWCESEDGKVLKDGKCTYKNSTGCSRHYKMVNGIPEDTFTQWDSRGSKCMVADHTIKKMCEENKLKYNSRTGICEVTKELCLQKGANWDSSKKDCVIPREQEVMEFIFGTTITRGLKQVFDPAQYKPCPSGTSDHGYVCNKHSRNPLPCTAYGSKWYNEGLRCANMLLSSTIPASCPSGYFNTGLSCEPKSFGRGAGYPWKFGDWAFSLDGARSRCSKANKQGCEQHGLIIYPKCPSGWHNVGCCFCRKSGPILMGFSKMTCPKNWFRSGALCYQKAKVGNSYKSVNTMPYKCPSGTTPWLGKCRTKCPSGWTDDGIGCWKPRKIAYSTK